MSKIIFERDKGMVELKLFPSITFFVDGGYCGVITAEAYELKKMYSDNVIKFYLGENQIFQRRYSSLEIKHLILENYEFTLIS